MSWPLGYDIPISFNLPRSLRLLGWHSKSGSLALRDSELEGSLALPVSQPEAPSLSQAPTRSQPEYISESESCPTASGTDDINDMSFSTLLSAA